MAFDYVSSQPRFTNSALLAIETGELFYFDDAGECLDDVPEDIHESDGYIDIPHKWDLDLGSALAHRFIQSNAPHLVEEIHQIFSRKGAYGRYKNLLGRSKLIDLWHEYENSETKAALQAWCNENGIELTNTSSPDD